MMADMTRPMVRRKKKLEEGEVVDSDHDEDAIEEMEGTGAVLFSQPHH